MCAYERSEKGIEFIMKILFGIISGFISSMGMRWSERF